MNCKNLLIFIFIPLFSFSQKPQDTRTPEKLVEAMKNVADFPKNENPVLFIYEKETADAIFIFDEMGEKGLNSFNQFRSNLQEKFPAYVVENKRGRIEIALDGSEALNTINFSYSATLISPQITERLPSDYSFISATEPDENQIAKLTLLIMGEEKVVDIKNTKEGYKLFLSTDMLQTLSEMTDKCISLEKVFSNANEMFKNGEITEGNFESKMDVISLQYIEAL